MCFFRFLRAKALVPIFWQNCMQQYLKYPSLHKVFIWRTWNSVLMKRFSLVMVQLAVVSTVITMFIVSNAVILLAIKTVAA